MSFLNAKRQRLYDSLDDREVIEQRDLGSILESIFHPDPTPKETATSESVLSTSSSSTLPVTSAITSSVSVSSSSSLTSVSSTSSLIPLPSTTSTTSTTPTTSESSTTLPPTSLQTPTHVVVTATVTGTSSSAAATSSAAVHSTSFLQNKPLAGTVISLLVVFAIIILAALVATIVRRTRRRQLYNEAVAFSDPVPTPRSDEGIIGVRRPSMEKRRYSGSSSGHGHTYGNNAPSMPMAQWPVRQVGDPYFTPTHMQGPGYQQAYFDPARGYGHAQTYENSLLLGQNGASRAHAASAQVGGHNRVPVPTYVPSPVGSQVGTGNVRTSDAYEGLAYDRTSVGTLPRALTVTNQS